MKDITQNYHKGADTSVAAFNDTPESAREQARAQVYSAIVNAARGMTCDEVEIATGMSHQTASARVTELKALGQIFDTGIKRKTRSGRTARVYTQNYK